MNPHYPLVAQRAAHLCEYCRVTEIVFNLPFEVEHINASIAIPSTIVADVRDEQEGDRHR